MGSELVPMRRNLPEIVDEDGHRVEGPDMDEVIKLLTGIAQNAQLARIRRALERRQIQGHKVTTILQVTDQLKWLDLLQQAPYVPWAKATFVNYGPNPVYLAVNDYYDFTRLLQWTELPLDYTEADQRIEYIGYKCDPGAAASIQVVATY
jgi:hypothetical protein